MIRSRVFVSLAISLFLANCLSAAAAANVPAAADRNKAVKDVNALKEFTKRVLKNAEAKFTKAKGTKGTVESQKKKADSAESDVRTAAESIKAKNRKAEALVIAEKAKKELINCNTIYQDAKQKAETATNSLEQFEARAKALVQSAEIEISPDSNKPDEYTKVIASATEFSTQTTTLSGQINASRLWIAAENALWTLKESAKKIQVFKYQAESLVIVSNIEAKLKTAETDIQSIQQNKDKTDIIVQEMDKTFQSAPNSLKSFFNSLCTNAEGFLRTAKSKVTEADKCNTDMQGGKTQLDGTLETLKATDDETKAGKEVETVKWHATYIDQQLQKIKEALQTAEYAFNSAKNVQKQMKNEMDKHKSPSGTKLNEDKQQDNVPTAEVTNPIRSGEAQNPAITETDKAVLGKSEDTMDQTSEQPVDANLDSTEENKSVQLTDKAKQNPKDDNSELLNKDMLRKMTKDITNNSLIGGEVPTWSAANDSAVTVFIPLLVIVVISAVLH